MEQAKEVVKNIASVGVIYRVKNPSEIFLEIKDDGFPLKAYRRHLCLIGGNWVGEAAKSDRSPRGTFLREFQEEISFGEAKEDAEELFALLGVTERGHLIRDFAPTEEDYQRLVYFKNVVPEIVEPYRDYFHLMPEAIVRRADPTYARGDMRAILSINLVPLDEEMWQILMSLQERYKNLSNESLSCILSLDLIIEKGLKFMAGYDRVLRQFWLECGLARANEVPLDFEGVVMEERGTPLGSYEEYLKLYEVATRPVLEGGLNG